MRIKCQTGEPTVASDGLTARCVGRWSEEKVYYISHYAEIFSTGMKNVFPERVYVDLFAGPGRCVRSDDGQETDGTPIKALQCKDPFTAYHFVEEATEPFNALQSRAKVSDRFQSISWYNKDANLAVKDIVTKIPRNTLTLAVIDPTGLHFTFDSLRTLTKGRKVDFIYLFPDGMDVRRNLETRYLAKPYNDLDDMLGTTSWRDAIKEERKKYPPTDDPICPDADKIVLKIFKEQIATLGYPHVTTGDDIQFKNSRQAHLYKLVFASRNPKGYEFWRKIQIIEPTGQRKMTYE
jgi:three-Cys-motif partner protein